MNSSKHSKNRGLSSRSGLTNMQIAMHQEKSIMSEVEVCASALCSPILKFFYVVIVITIGVSLYSADINVVSSIDEYFNQGEEEFSSKVGSSDYSPFVINKKKKMSRDSLDMALAFQAVNYDHSSCAQEFWLSMLYEVEPSPDKVFLNVGFNKGYNFAIWLSLWMPSLGINPRSWYSSMLNHSQSEKSSSAGEMLCGYCKDCKVNLVESVRTSRVKAVRAIQKEFKNKDTERNSNATNEVVRLYGFDINSGDLKFFDQTIAQFSPITNEKGEIVVEIPKQTCDWQGCTDTPKDLHGSAVFKTFHAAVDEQDVGSIWSEKCSIGQENCKIAPNQRSVEGSTEYVKGFYEKVNRMSIDSFARKYITKRPPRTYVVKNAEGDKTYTYRATALIDILVVDTEGQDPRIIKGTLELLKKQDVRLLVFEYDQECPWASYPLEAIVDYLDNFRYDCYFVGTHRLWKITGPAWHPLFEIRSRSNVICSLRDDYWWKVIDNLKVKQATAAQILAEHNRDELLQDPPVQSIFCT